MPSVIEQIKERLDIVSYIGQHVPSLKKAGRLYKACCPFHSEKTPSFVVNPITQTWRCFGACAEGGDILTFAQKMHHWNFGEALQELGRIAGIEVRPPTPQQKEHDARLERLRGLLQTAAEYYHQHLLSDDPKSRETLHYTREKRGFTDETIQQFMIGYAPAGWTMMLDALKKIGFSESEILEAGLASRNDSGRVFDRFRHRLMIPIRDERGRVTGFGARALDPADNPKYLNSPQSVVFDKSRTLFGLDKAKNAIQDSGMAVIVEGYMDAIQAHQAGYRNVVAQMGTALTETQLKLLVPRHTQKIILALDADAAGQNATRRSLEVARTALQSDYAGKLGVDIRILHIDDAKDPDDVLRETPEKWPVYVESAKPAADFVMDMETAALPTSATLQERQTAAQRVLPILTASEDNLYRKDNLQKLAVRLHLPETDLLAWADELRRQAAQRRKATSLPNKPPSRAKQPADDISAPVYRAIPGANAEEPPLYFPDDRDIPPPDYDDYSILPDDLTVPAQTTAPMTKPTIKSAGSPTMPGFQARHASRDAEGYCLQMMLQNPPMLYAANRKLREPGQADAALLDAGLSNLCEEDFSQSDYRILFGKLLQAVDQDDVDTLEYIRLTVEDVLQQELHALLMGEDDKIRHRLNGRMAAELTDVIKKYHRSVHPMIDAQRDFLDRVLQVRINRLQRELQELRFLVAEAQQSADIEAVQRYSQQVQPMVAALRLLQRELHQ